jgi:hypothetical protein
VRDLLGVSGSPAASFAPDEQVGAFHSNAVAPVTDLNIEQYMAAAESLANEATEDVSTLLPCDPAVSGEDECAGEFISDFGARAYRRPLTDGDVAQLELVYQIGKQTDFASGIRMIVQTALQSPYFLYHVELPTAEAAGGLVRLDGYQLASRLSYFLWLSMPDRELFDAAAGGALDTREGVQAQAERLLADPKAQQAIATFHMQWLRLGELEQLVKDPDAFPEFDVAMRQAMHDETVRFADYVIREGDGRLETLLSAPYSFPSGPLVELYGLDVANGNYEPTQLAESERAGLLTHASLLATHAHGDQTSPVHRGVLVRENILCQTLPTPPENVNNTPPDPDPNLTTRERFAAHTEDPACASCHKLIDGIGFGFENYDAIGRYRDSENGKDVDASGVIGGTGDINGSFDGVVELAHMLATSDTVRDCMTRQWFRFAFGRVESDEDAAVVDSLHSGFASSDYDLRQLLYEIVTSDAFIYRRQIEEVTP